MPPISTPAVCNHTFDVVLDNEEIYEKTGCMLNVRTTYQDGEALCLNNGMTLYKTDEALFNEAPNLITIFGYEESAIYHIGGRNATGCPKFFKNEEDERLFGIGDCNVVAPAICEFVKKLEPGNHLFLSVKLQIIIVLFDTIAIEDDYVYDY